MKLSLHNPQKYFKLLTSWLAVLVLLSSNTAMSNTPSQNHFLVPISLQFTDIELTELLETMAKLGNTNFLLSESIKGKISCTSRAGYQYLAS